MDHSNPFSGVPGVGLKLAIVGEAECATCGDRVEGQALCRPRPIRYVVHHDEQPFLLLLQKERVKSGKVSAMVMDQGVRKVVQNRS